jgi:hypothetical protein
LLRDKATFFVEFQLYLSEKHQTGAAFFPLSATFNILIEKPLLFHPLLHYTSSRVENVGFAQTRRVDSGFLFVKFDQNVEGKSSKMNHN